MKWFHKQIGEDITPEKFIATANKMPIDAPITAEFKERNKTQ